MTAPSLLDELEGVMAARAEWIESHSDTAWNELALLSVNFVSANCTTLADMAKRLEAAEKDAARWRHARKLLTVDDIEGAQGSYDSFGRLVSEDECKRADDAIDAATQDGEG